MNKLLKFISLKILLIEILPSFSISLLVAECFYKLGSFSLECVAFLTTWFVLGSLISAIITKVGSDNHSV